MVDGPSLFRDRDQHDPRVMLCGYVATALVTWLAEIPSVWRHRLCSVSADSNSLIYRFVACLQVEAKLSQTALFDSYAFTLCSRSIRSLCRPIVPIV